MTLPKSPMSEHSQRSPAPFGYSQACVYDDSQQMALVAEFHINRISAARIAYRTGVDYQKVLDLIAGDLAPERFKALMRYYKAQRREARIRAAQKLKSGSARFEAASKAQQD